MNATGPPPASYAARRPEVLSPSSSEQERGGGNFHAPQPLCLSRGRVILLSRRRLIVLYFLVLLHGTKENIEGIAR